MNQKKALLVTFVFLILKVLLCPGSLFDLFFAQKFFFGHSFPFFYVSINTSPTCSYKANQKQGEKHDVVRAYVKGN